MIEFNKAQALIFELAQQLHLETEAISLEFADGRICSEDIFSPEAVPSFNNSAMDGFAIRSVDTKSASVTSPLRLNVASSVAAGDEVKFFSAGTQAIEIMTGAPLPEVFDAVVKIEDVEVFEKDGFQIKEICIRSVVPPKNNIREKGSDYLADQLILPQGSMIRAESMMALASVGVFEVSVLKKPKVAILSTGKELVSFNTRNLKPGMIRNSTGLYLKTALSHLGVNVTHVDSISDETDCFKRYLNQILDENTDVLVTTGAVSMGKYDFIPSVLQEMGAEIIFHKVAIRPGKPILMAKVPRKGCQPLVVFGIPGNPVSSAVGSRFFLAPFFRALNRQKSEKGMQVKLSERTNKPEGLRCFFKAKLENSRKGYLVTALSGQASFMVSSLVEANSWVIFPEAGGSVEKDEEVFVYPLLPDQSFNLECL